MISLKAVWDVQVLCIARFVFVCSLSVPSNRNYISLYSLTERLEVGAKRDCRVSSGYMLLQGADGGEIAYT